MDVFLREYIHTIVPHPQLSPVLQLYYLNLTHSVKYKDDYLLDSYMHSLS